MVHVDCGGRGVFYFNFVHKFWNGKVIGFFEETGPSTVHCTKLNLTNTLLRTAGMSLLDVLMADFPILEIYSSSVPVKPNREIMLTIM